MKQKIVNILRYIFAIPIAYAVSVSFAIISRLLLLVILGFLERFLKSPLLDYLALSPDNVISVFYVPFIFVNLVFMILPNHKKLITYISSALFVIDRMFPFFLPKAFNNSEFVVSFIVLALLYCICTFFSIISVVNKKRW